MAQEQFTIPKRWSFQSAVTVTIECDPLAPNPIKLGLAVRAAYGSDADLSDADLRGAVLSGADLSGADLSGADLSGAVLSDAVLRGAVLRGADLRGADLRDADLSDAVLRGAVLRGAVLSGEKIERLIASVNRLDGYTFYAFQMRAGGVKIAAGCRWFTVAQFHAHVASEYPGTDKAAETTDILGFIEARAKSLGVALEPVSEAA